MTQLKTAFCPLLWAVQSHGSTGVVSFWLWWARQRWGHYLVKFRLVSSLTLIQSNSNSKTRAKRCMFRSGYVKALMLLHFTLLRQTWKSSLTSTWNNASLMLFGFFWVLKQICTGVSNLDNYACLVLGSYDAFYYTFGMKTAVCGCLCACMCVFVHVCVCVQT